MTVPDPPKTAASTDIDMTNAAVIIPADQHPITLGMIDRDALYVLRKLGQAGFSGYLVGGGVRDLYLGKKPKDFDISTDARPGQLRKLFPNSNTIGRRFRLVQVFFKGGKTIEVSTLRSLSEFDMDGPEAVLAPNNTFGTLHEDARRRDLTINSLFYEIENETIIDYVSGSLDLDRRLIRIVGDPEVRLRRDPVRMMRAIRHAARNDFMIEDDSWKAICKNAKSLTLCPPSRLRDELLKDLYSEASSPWFDLALKSGLFYSLFPSYSKILEKNTDTAELLHGLFFSIDTLNKISRSNGVHRQRDFFLLALLLTPWAESKYQLFSCYRKGAPLFKLGKTIRQDLDDGIGIHLNLRRSLRQEVVNLLINLAQLTHLKQKSGWPKWLKKKSYFKRSLLFYHCYQAALHDSPLTLEHIAPGHSPRRVTEDVPSPQATSGPKYKPAFARKTKGGIFGFKKQ